MSTLDLAKAVAEHFHAGQKYGKEAYVYHLNMVASSLKRENDDRLPIIGMLHDVLEDTTCTSSVLCRLFDDDIYQAIVALSKVVNGVTQDDSYEKYIARVKANQLAKIVKMHDTLCNLEESLVRRDMKRVRKYSKQLQLLAE